MDLTVVTYNILAQSFILPKRYPLSPPESLAAAPRQALLLARLAALDADLLCLQEVEPAMFAAITAHLGPGYDARHLPRRGRPDGVAILARRSAATIREETALRDEKHDTLLARLDTPLGPLALASAHLSWHPQETPPDEHSGRRHLLQILDAVAEIDAPRKIVAGDLNATADSAVVGAAFERGWEESCRSQRPWDTAAINGRARKLDFLLYTPETLDPHPGTLPKLRRDTPLPSSEEPSDHLPVWVRYTRR